MKNWLIRRITTVIDNALWVGLAVLVLVIAAWVGALDEAREALELIRE